MGAKKNIAIVLLVFGLFLFAAGVRQINKANTPDTCVVSFARSLGGKASFELSQSVQMDRYFGVAGISLGVILFSTGSFLLFKSIE